MGGDNGGRLVSCVDEAGGSGCGRNGRSEWNEMGIRGGRAMKTGWRERTLGAATQKRRRGVYVEQIT
jgi:hypothetical protein